MELQFMIGTYTNIETNICSKDIWPTFIKNWLNLKKNISIYIPIY